MFGLWWFGEARVGKPIKYLKWFSFYGCSKHWPLNLSVGLRLKYAYYHFKSKNIIIYISTLKGTLKKKIE